MAIIVFSDPHLGRTMQAHTTAGSRIRLQEAIFHSALQVAAYRASAKVVCLGDLFDKFQNPERVIQQGAEVVGWCDYVMAGNHDLTADRNKLGSLELLAALDPAGDACKILLSGFGESRCYLHRVDGCDFVFVPHHTTDGLFQQSLEDALEWVSTRPATEQVERKAYLCLHCNYDSGYAIDETALTLSRKQARWLLDRGFDYILIGHDHHPREDWDGRVIVLGNTHPTGFGDITTKRYLQVNDDGSHQFNTVWSPEGRYVELDAEMLLGGEPEAVPAGVQFIDITGKVRPEHVMHMAKAVRGLWNTYEPLAIRNRAEIQGLAGGDAVNYDFQSIDRVILDDLQGAPELRDLFKSYWDQTAPGVGDE